MCDPTPILEKYPIAPCRQKTVNSTEIHFYNIRTMKKLIGIVMATVALTAAAQNKIDYAGRLAVEQYRLELANSENVGQNTLTALSATAVPTYNVVVEFDESGIDLGNVDAEIVSVIGETAILAVTPAQMEELAALPQVKRITLGFENRPLMKAARAATFVDEVQNGTGLDGKKFNGTGVIASLFDTGLDVNHINFLDAERQPRTKSLWVYSGSSGRPNVYSDPVSISNYTSETTAETHATHVLGIMAGGYNGPADYVAYDSKGRVVKTTQSEEGSAIPYYGVATNAELALACGPLYDANILSGVQNIVEYAKAQKKPCVVNLSIGNNIGPHDGTDAFSRTLATLGKDAIIFISAGNEGNENISIATTGEELKTFVGNDNNTTTVAGGFVDLWGSDNQVFDVKVFTYNRAVGREVFSYTLSQNLAGKNVAQTDMTGFAQSGFTGTVRMSSNVDTGNNRYNVGINLNVQTNDTQILFGIAVIPKTGQTINGFANNLVFMSQGQPGFASGSPDNSVNGMACGENVIVVGSFCTASTFPVLTGSSMGYQGSASVGSISNFSSYGYNTISGHPLPDVCAPGEVVISSVNQYYVNARQLGNGSLSAIYTMEGSGLFTRNSSWQAMQGTSMASPFAAGVVATWLEADPTLKVNDVRDIINSSSTTDLMIMSQQERWGAGKINALDGMKEVLERRSGVKDVTNDAESALVSSVDGRNFEIYVYGANKIEARLFSLSGACVAASSVNGNTLTISADNAAAGIYVMRISSDKNTETRKLTVR